MKAEQRLELAQAADYCVRWLKANSIKVVRIEGEAAQPRIIVKHNALCDLFEDIVVSYERSWRGEHRCAWVHRFDCQIKWTVPAANPHKPANLHREMSNA